MAGLAFRSVSTAATAASGNLTLIAPAGAVEGDLYVAPIVYRDTAPFTIPAGWSLVATQQSSGNTSTTTSTSIASGLMAYCIRGSGEPDLTFTRSGGDVAYGQIACYSNPHRGNPFDTGTANTLGANSTTVTTGTFTTAEDHELLVMACGFADNTTASAQTAATNPASVYWHERADSNTTTGADTGLAIADATKLTAGATGTLQYTAGNSSRHVCIVGAFRARPTNINISRLTTTKRRIDNQTTDLTTSSFTPPNNCLLVVATGCAASAAGTVIDNSMVVSDSLGGTWTKRTQEGSFHGGWDYDVAIWTRPVDTGASMTVSLGHPNAQLDAETLSVFAVTGYDVADPVGGSGTAANPAGTTASHTLSAAPADGDLTIAARKYDDSGTTSPAAIPGVGFVELDENQNGSGWTELQVQARWFSTSTTVAWTDTGPTGSDFDVAAVSVVINGAPSLTFSPSPMQPFLTR